MAAARCPPAPHRLSPSSGRAGGGGGCGVGGHGGEERRGQGRSRAARRGASPGCYGRQAAGGGRRAGYGLSPELPRTRRCPALSAGGAEHRGPRSEVLRAGATGLNGSGCNLVFWGQEEQPREPGLVRLEKMLRTGFHPESQESSSLLQTAVSVLQSCYLDSTSQDGFQYSQAILVENAVFLNELKAFVQAKEAAGYSQEELEETFAFLLFDNEEEAKEVCQTGLRVNSSSISMLGDPAKGVYISKYADCLLPRPWYHGKSGYIVICKLIKGKVKVVSENYTTSYTCPSPGYDCHVAVSKNIVPSKASPCQAFEQSQYYVYEVSDGSAAERPRQICPYIVITCQYREPKEMPVLARESLPEPNHKAFYCPWRGQLSIRGQLLCNIALRTPYSSTIPAQLPPNLDINHVMGLSDLKKKLPKAAFGKRNYIENEVCFQGVYFSLYEVEIANKDQHKMNQLLENLKKRDLAIIKYLQDQGVLILLTSSALARDDGFDPKEPVSLLALFLFTSSRAVCLRDKYVRVWGTEGDGDRRQQRAAKRKGAEEHDAKDERRGSDVSLKIASVLPGLRYALQKATTSPRGDALSTDVRIKQHFQEYAKLEQNAQHPSGQNDDAPRPSPLPPAKDECTKSPTKSSEQSFCQLQHYLSDPSSYTLEMSAALGCLAGAAPSLCCSLEAARKGDCLLALPPDPAPPVPAEVKLEGENPQPTVVGLDWSGEAPPKDVSSGSELWMQQNKRKSSQTAGTSTGKKWSPLKMQIHPGGDSSRDRKGTKKKITFSFPKKTGLTASSSEPMLKLANLEFPHRRKRGAEVLSAEFVHNMQPEPAQKETSAPDSPGLDTKRPKTLKNLDVKKVPAAETSAKPLKSKVIKSVASSPLKLAAKKPAESEGKEPFATVPSEVSSPSPAAESQTGEIYPGAPPSHFFDPKGNDYESHALNLLADLALGSCIPSFIPRDSGAISSPCSPPRDPAKEQQGLRKQRSSRAASDHEYHRVDKLAKGAASPGKASPNLKLPPAAKTDLKDPLPGEKNPGLAAKKINPNPAKTRALLPRETQEAAEANKHSFISSEHSYASLLPENLKKPPYPKNTSYPGPAPARNGTRGARAGPLVGKVLPFRHQQSSSHPQPPAEATAARCRGCLLSPRLKEDFAESHSVESCGKSLQVTRRWEAGYLFSSDSKYTNDELEKTVIRALHGPWDPELPDDVEEMKLILHMWVALFYSKPSKVLSSRRKVVEHSNPKKFVSLNSTGDFLELSDDGEDGFGSEPCPVDSQSEPEQAPSSSLHPSTRCQGVFRPEESLADSTVSSSSGELPPGEEEPSSTSSESLSLADRAARSKLAEKCRQLDLPEEEHGCAGSIAAVVELPREGQKDASITPSPSNAASTPPAVLGREKPRNRALNFSPAPQRTPHGPGEQPESGASRSTSSNPNRAKPEGLGGEGRASQDPSARPEIEEEEVEEGEAEEEGSGHGSTGVGTSGLAFSGRGDADAEQQLVNLACPRDFGVPGEGPDPIPAASALPREGKTMPALFGTGAASRGLSGDAAPSVGVLQEPWGALATPGAEKTSITLPHEASPAAVGDSSSVPTAPSTHLGVPTAGSGAGEGLRGGLEQEDEDRAPSAESLLLLGSQAAATAGLEAQGQARSSSPGSSSARRAFLDGAAAVGAAPGVQEAAALVQAPWRSSPGGRSCLPRGCGGETCASGSSGESSQEQNKALVEERGGSSPASHPDVLGESSGAGAGRGFAFDCTAWAGDSKPDSSSLAACTASAAAPLVQEPPRGADVGAPRCFFGQNERGAILCPPGKPCERGAAAELSAAAEIPAPDSSLKPGFVGEVKKDPGLCRMEPTESSPPGVLMPGEVEPAPCSPPRSPEAVRHGAEPDSVLGAHPDANPAPCGATRPCFGGQQPPGACCTCATPQIQAAGVLGSHEEESEGGSSVPCASPEALPAGSVPRGEDEAEEPGVVTDPHRAEVEGEEGAIPVPHWGCFAPISPPLTPSRGARTKHDSSSSSLSEAWGSEENLRWAEPGGCSGLEEASSRQVPPYVNITDSRGVSKDFLNFTVTKKTQRGRRGNARPSRRRRPCAGQSHLLRALLGPWRGREEITQHTLDMEHLRFHYKLNQILRRGQPPLSTSESIFPRDRSLQAASETIPGQETPVPPSPRSRSPLQVTILPSTPWPDGFGCPQPPRDPSSRCPPWHERSRNRDLAAPFHLGKLKYEKTPREPPGAASAILSESPQLDGVTLSGVETGGEDKGKGSARVEAFGDLVAELCGSLRGRLRSVAKGACGSPGMFYLVETGEEPFFARVKTLLKKDGHVEMEPLSFCSAKRPASDRLLVVIRNEDISSHIHKVPGLLSLKHCPNVAFAGVDSPEDITVHTYQELFHTGGFVVSDDKVLETVTPGQLKEVVKVLEKLNGSGRWKWLLHYKESKKLQKDLRWDTNAQKKSLILKSCQGAELIEVLHYHACDSRASPSSEYVKCLLNLQVQHVSARFAVYLTEKPGASRELFESKGILVADVNTFLGTVQKVAAPFRRSYW